METFLGRYRNLIVLVCVVFVQALGLAVQIKRTTGSDSSRLIRVWAVGSVSPLEKALVWTQTSTGNLWHNYLYMRGVRAENRDLKLQIEQMRIEQVRLTQDADQARRLQSLLAFKEQFISQTMAAQVIGSTGSEQSRGVYLDKGEKDGIKPDMAVMTADGVVGKVLHVYRGSALVLLLDDQSSGVGAILEKSRLQGILKGSSGGDVILDKVMSDETVPTGERVLTSGGDRIFPKGLAIGVVSRVTTGSEGFLAIRVKPAANLSKLEEVLIVTKVDERQQATPDPTSPLRAADVLAERLPTVPPKPPDAGAAAATGAASQSGTAVPANPAQAKPKPTANTGNAVAVPVARKVVVSAPVNKTVDPSAAGTAAGEQPKKTAKPADEPKPQPPSQDAPQ